jgi:membrane protein implicated in regulation of membrane protease activity
MSLIAMEQRAGILCTLDALLVLEWYFLTGSLLLPVLSFDLILIAFVTAALLNNLFCWYFLKDARKSRNKSSMEVMGQLTGVSEKLVFVGGMMRRDALFGMVLSSTIIVDFLTVYLLLVSVFS